ncbi:leucyl aminopeptidase [Poseidonocella pacifica]|uniref:Probable cytosol aminopeptidase n=1 Tax=Poseidonocella pacifica TaxID=871651 RepID=A0A1I0VAP9_9RHOB|nr:leucyl aminopeptidase [Poseidonocella pacifica]SFA73338.1 leucyl aminopeptidase [Poseidonocella pacifica]
MTDVLSFQFAETDLEAIATAEGRVAVVVGADGKMGPAARRLNRLSKGAVARLVGAERFEKAKPGDVLSLAFPAGMEAEAIDVVKLDRRAGAEEARKAGASLAKAKGSAALTVCLGSIARPAEVVLGLAMRAYAFSDHKSDKPDAAQGVTVMCTKPDEAEAAAAPVLAVAEGAFFTRDLVSEPANVLNTVEFADRLVALSELGVEVEVLEEADMEALGMGALLSVGHGSAQPSKMVVMKWMGGGDESPLALVGKGVVFDTGGISLKPAAGMEDMTMDMGGAGVVSGVMKTLARRKAKANVVGLVGIVENMPSDRATRPGDVVTSMKGDTIEVINTDAEGRLVLADVLWYAQEKINPSCIVDLATLTGAAIIALGHENAGVLSNDDEFVGKFLKAAAAEGEGAWRLPLGQGYADLIKSRIADVKNSGGRPAGTITAAEFLHRFIKDGMPWIHLDIAGVASVKAETKLAPQGATGWGVLSLNRLVQEYFEN